MEIEIIQSESDSTDHLANIAKALNDRFTTQEQMEFRFEIHCESVARELGAQIIFKPESILFNFTGWELHDEQVYRVR